MSTITVFANGGAKHGDHRFNSFSMAVINCDAKYDNKALNIENRDELNEFIKKSKKFKFFCEIELVND